MAASVVARAMVAGVTYIWQLLLLWVPIAAELWDGSVEMGSTLSAEIKSALDLKIREITLGFWLISTDWKRQAFSMLVIFWRELLNWGYHRLHRFPVSALGCVNDHTALLSEGRWQSAKHLKAVWWLFVALSWANESSLEIYVSKVIFLVTQRPAGPSVSTAPVQPWSCFMLDPNRLINHSSGHYGYSFTQTSHRWMEHAASLSHCWSA